MSTTNVHGKGWLICTNLALRQQTALGIQPLANQQISAASSGAAVLQHQLGSYNRLHHHKVLFPLPGWRHGRKKHLFPWVYLTSSQHLEIVGCPSISPLYPKEENSSALEPLKENCKPISSHTKMHKRFVALVVWQRRALRKHMLRSHSTEQTDWSA